MSNNHYQKLEQMYLSAPINKFYLPQISVTEGKCVIETAVKEEFFHAANAVHGSVYGKILREFQNGLGAEKYLTTHHERDKETGLDYRGARYYDSDVARFLSLDPLAMQFVNLSPYNYVFDNPTMFVDPSGRAPEGKSSDGNSEKESGWNQNHIDLLETFGDPSGFSSVIENNIDVGGSRNTSASEKDEDDETQQDQEDAMPGPRDTRVGGMSGATPYAISQQQGLPYHPQNVTKTSELFEVKNGAYLIVNPRNNDDKMVLLNNQGLQISEIRPFKSENSYRFDLQPFIDNGSLLNNQFYLQVTPLEHLSIYSIDIYEPYTPSIPRF